MRGLGDHVLASIHRACNAAIDPPAKAWHEQAYSHMDEYLKADPDGRFAGKIKSIMQQMKASVALGQPEAAKCD